MRYAMISRLVRVFSWGGRYCAAGLSYFAMGLGALTTIADLSPPVAASGACGTGYYDCRGMCIPVGNICCSDGTSGDASVCCCCSDSETAPDSIFCPNPADYGL